MLLASALAVALVGAAVWRMWPHVRFRWLFEPLGKNAQGYLEYRHRSTGVIFVRVPGGRSWIGAQKSDPKGQNYDRASEPDEEPVHLVELSPFLIAKYETSQAEWERIMLANPSRYRGPGLPVEEVSWNDCQECCRKSGLELPSEAQWEVACRGGTTSPFAFGVVISRAQANCDCEDIGGTSEPGPPGTVLVTAFEPNAFGLYQMHGNVVEYCRDYYDARFYETSEATLRDPVCSAPTELRVARGGGWFLGYCRSAERHSVDPTEGNSNFGNYGVRLAYYPLP